MTADQHHPGADDRLPGAPAAAPPEHLARIGQVAGIGCWSLNRRLRRLRWSPELRALHGLSEQDPVPRAADWLLRHVHPDDRERTRRTMAEWHEQGLQTLQYGLRVLRPDGSQRELLTHSMVDRDDSSDLVYGVVIDVTPMRQTEQALRQAEGRVALTANAVGLGTWEVDLDTEAVRWDPAMWLLRGLVPRLQAPSFPDRLAMVHADDRQHLHSINSRHVSANYEFRVVWPDGQVRWLSSRATTLHDEQGRPMRRIGVNWDVTSQREAEASLRQRELALRDSETRSRALARMSHELRTPLHAILGCTQLLQGGEADDPVVRQQRLAEIERAGRELLGLVDRVLDLTGRDATSAPVPQSSPVPAPTATAPRRTVLYIEDNSVNALIVSELIARRGDLAVVIAETGHDGLRQALALQPSLVLLDMQLPDIDGSEVFRRLQADPRTAALTCVALSANVMQADIDAALAAGMTAYWTKPLDFAAFARALEALFGPPPPR